MSNLAIRTGTYRAEDMTIEQIIDELYTVSFPDLYCMAANGKFTATAEMRIKVQGAEFKVRSGHSHDTAISALRELLLRVRAAMAQLEQAKGGAV